MPTEGRWTTSTNPVMAETALRCARILAGQRVDFLLPDLTRWGATPPVPFGPSERKQVAESVEEQLRKKYNLPG